MGREATLRIDAAKATQFKLAWAWAVREGDLCCVQRNKRSSGFSCLAEAYEGKGRPCCDLMRRLPLSWESCMSGGKSPASALADHPSRGADSCVLPANTCCTLALLSLVARSFPSKPAGSGLDWADMHRPIAFGYFQLSRTAASKLARAFRFRTAAPEEEKKSRTCATCATEEESHCLCKQTPAHPAPLSSSSSILRLLL